MKTHIRAEDEPSYEVLTLLGEQKAASLKHVLVKNGFSLTAGEKISIKAINTALAAIGISGDLVKAFSIPGLLRYASGGLSVVFVSGTNDDSYYLLQ
ncbi:MAG: hypothetical protein BroJett025_02590 [Patescibacteria group bacterium]|nr:MAG: hypothetical protein BroJett025_02590 [Patescibacteria group bacterium]